LGRVTPIRALKRSIRTGIKLEEAQLLRDYATGRTVLELGSQFGFSTVLMAEVAKRVDAVDWHGGDECVGHEPSLPTFTRNLHRFHVNQRVVPYIGRNADILPTLSADYDFAFHDSFHETEAVIEDVGLMLPLLKPGALIAFHDFGVEKEHFGVSDAIEILGLRLVAIARTMVVCATTS
jgi:predicted O-methyltransferase YrrM